MINNFLINLLKSYKVTYYFGELVNFSIRPFNKMVNQKPMAKLIIADSKINWYFKIE